MRLFLQTRPSFNIAKVLPTTNGGQLRSITPHVLLPISSVVCCLLLNRLTKVLVLFRQQVAMTSTNNGYSSKTRSSSRSTFELFKLTLFYELVLYKLGCGCGWVKDKYTTVIHPDPRTHLSLAHTYWHRWIFSSFLFTQLLEPNFHRFCTQLLIDDKSHC